MVCVCVCMSVFAFPYLVCFFDRKRQKPACWLLAHKSASAQHIEPFSPFQPIWNWYVVCVCTKFACCACACCRWNLVFPRCPFRFHFCRFLSCPISSAFVSCSCLLNVFRSHTKFQVCAHNFSSRSPSGFFASYFLARWGTQSHLYFLFPHNFISLTFVCIPCVVRLFGRFAVFGGSVCFLCLFEIRR